MRAEFTFALHQIIAVLQAQEKAFGEAEIAREAQVGVGRDGALGVNDFVDAARRHATGEARSQVKGGGLRVNAMMCVLRVFGITGT